MSPLPEYLDRQIHYPEVAIRLGGNFIHDRWTQEVDLEDGEVLGRSGSALKGWVPKYVNTSDSSAVANTTSETDFDVSHTLPADKIVAGDILRAHFSGIVEDSGSSPTLTLRFKLEGDTIVTVGPTTLTAGAEVRWEMDVECVYRSLTSVWAASRVVRVGALRPTNARATDSSRDTTADFDVELSAQWSAAHASNTITLETFLLEHLRG